MNHMLNLHVFGVGKVWGHSTTGNERGYDDSYVYDMGDDTSFDTS